MAMVVAMAEAIGDGRQGRNLAKRHRSCVMGAGMAARTATSSWLVWLIGLILVCACGIASGEFVLQLDGRSSHITAPLPKGMATGLFSIGVWVKVERTSNSQQTLVAFVKPGFKSRLEVSWVRDRFMYSDSYLEEKPVMTWSVSQDDWHYVVLSGEPVDLGVYMDSFAEHPAHRNMTLYVDGKVGVNFVTLFPDYSGGTISAGVQLTKEDKRHYFAGQLDELRVYKGRVKPKDVLDLSFVKPVGSELNRLFLYYSFNDLDDGTEGRVVTTANMVDNGTTWALVHFCRRAILSLTPYDPIFVLGGPARKHPHNFENANYDIPRSPMKGLDITVIGSNFFESPFLTVRIVSPNDSVEANSTMFLGSTRLESITPPFSHPTKAILQVGNGGANVGKFDWEIEFLPGEDLEENLMVFFQFMGDAMNVLDKTDGTYAATGIPSLFFTEDRNSVAGRAVAFQNGTNQIEFAAAVQAALSWTFCAWVFIEKGNWELYYELDGLRRRDRKVNVIEVVDGGAAGYGQVKLDGHGNGVIVWDAWQFLCVATNGATSTFFSSGIKRNATSLMDVDPDTSSRAAAVTSVLAPYFRGKVDDVYIWRRELREAEINQLYLLGEEGGIELDGRGTSYIQITSTGGSTDFNSQLWRPQTALTIEVWVKPKTSAAAAGQKVVLSQGMTGTTPLQEAWYLYFQDGALAFSINVDNNNLSPAEYIVKTDIPVITLEKWMLLTATYDGNLGTLAVNGIEVKRMPFPAPSAGYNTMMPMYLGRPVTRGEYFIGQIGEVRLWSVALPESAIYQNYLCSPPVGTVGMTAKFPMNHGFGRVHNDEVNRAVTLRFVGPKRPFWVYGVYPEDDGNRETIRFNRSTVAGEGTVEAWAGTQTYFTAQAHGRCGNLLKKGGDEIQGVVFGPLSTNNGKVMMSTIVDNGDGTYTGHYDYVTLCGLYNLRVESTRVPPANGRNLDPEYQEFIFSGSPYTFRMQPGPTSANGSIAYDPFWNIYSLGITATEGMRTSFVIQARDQYGCIRITGGETFSAVLEGRYTVPATVQDWGNGTYQVTYVPWTSGPIRLAVRFNGKHIGRYLAEGAEVDVGFDCSKSLRLGNKGSPWCVNVQASQASIMFNSVSGAEGWVQINSPFADRIDIGSDAGFTIDAWVRPIPPPFVMFGNKPVALTGRGSGPFGGQVIISKTSARTGQGWWVVLEDHPVDTPILGEAGLVNPSDGEVVSRTELASRIPRVLVAQVYVGSGRFRRVRGDNTTVPLSTWSHICVTYNGRRMMLFINGVLAGSSEWDDFAAARLNAQPVMVGKGFSGQIDEVRVWKMAQPASEIKRVIACPMQPHDGVLYLRFSEGRGFFVYDSSVNLGMGRIFTQQLIVQPGEEPISPAPSAGFAAWVTPRSVNDPTAAPIYPSILDPERSFLTHDSVFDKEGAKKITGPVTGGQMVNFTVTLVDTCGSIYQMPAGSIVSATYQGLGNQRWESTSHTGLRHPQRDGGTELPINLIQVPDNCLNAGYFSGSYEGWGCGMGFVKVTFNGQVIGIQGVEVKAGPTAAPKSTVFFPSTKLVAGQSATVLITARDAHGCMTMSSTEEFHVLVTRTSKGPRPLDPAMWGPDAVSLHSKATHLRQGLYMAVFTPPAAGNYTIDVGKDDGRGFGYLLGGRIEEVVVEPSPWRKVIAWERGLKGLPGIPGGVSVLPNLPAPRYGSVVETTPDGDMVVLQGWGRDKTAMTEVWEYPLRSPTRLGSFGYRMNFTFDGLKSRHELRVVINSRRLVDEGKMRGDCADVHLIHAETGDPIRFWPEGAPGCGSERAGFWFVAPAIPTVTIYLYYGNANYPEVTGTATPPSMRVKNGAELIKPLFESFENKLTPEQNRWRVIDGCSLPRGDIDSFRNVANVTEYGNVGAERAKWKRAADDNRAMQVNTKRYVGGSIVKRISGGSLSSYILHAEFYDTDSDDSSHWISPDFDDCSSMESTAGKLILPRRLGLGVNSDAVFNQYAMLYPWRGTGVERTAGWHAFEFECNGTHTMLRVDDVTVGVRRATVPIWRVFIRGGGSNAGQGVEDEGYWDNILVGQLDEGVRMEMGEEEAVVWENKRWKTIRVGGRKPPPRNSHSAAKDDLGRLWLIGGFQGEDLTGRAAIWYFNLIGKHWTEVQPWGSLSPGPRNDHTVVVYERKVYVYGGRAGREIRKDIWVFDAEDNAWLPPIDSLDSDSSAIAAAASSPLLSDPLSGPNYQAGGGGVPKGPKGRFCHSAVVYGRGMYVFGGYRDSDAGAPIAVNPWVMMSSPSSSSAANLTASDVNSTIRLLSLSSPAAEMQALQEDMIARRVAAARELLTTTPPKPGGVTNELWRFDFVTETWRELTPRLSPSPRHSHIALVRGGSMYISGGVDTQGILMGEIWRYDFEYNRWSQLYNERIPNIIPSSTTGKANASHTFQSSEPSPASRNDHGATMRGLDLFLFGGHGPRVYPSDFWSTTVY